MKCNCIRCGSEIRHGICYTCCNPNTEGLSNQIPKGWECPKCGKVNAPTVTECCINSNTQK